MKELTLLRHAKAAAALPGQADRERGLQPRGEAAALAIGRWLRRQEAAFDLALVSPATRARDSWALVASQLDGFIPTRIEPLLYMQGPAAILARLAELEDEIARVILVGHNPDFHALARRFAVAGDPARREALARKLPTGGLARFAIEAAHWSEAAEAPSRLEAFVRPKELV